MNTIATVQQLFLGDSMVWTSLLNSEEERGKSDRFLAVDTAGIDRPKKRESHTFRPEGMADYQLLYVSKGQGRYRVGETVQDVLNGQFLLYAPGELQEYWYDGWIGPEIYWIHFAGTGAEGFLSRLGLCSGRVYETDRRPETSELFRQVLASVLSGGKYGKEEAAARLAVLLVRLAEMAAEETEGVSTGMEKIQPAVEYLNAHFTRSTSTEELAGLCSLSPSRFLHLFTEEMGISPSRYKRGLRMQAAKELLRYGGQTVSEVADTLGYNDPLHFSRVFRKEAGIAPSRYRELFGKAGLQSGGFRGIMKETDAAEDGIFKTGAEFE